ncbi:site-specific DNA recombinase [Marininema mesophilum]|uniref:Site-specific DNA recombinase n=1 Tax=Marininema mesophilum TaxID=1048340 RepID=A0A1H2RC08_9BACL|nr:recombinase family protein [Marininema mesophilum]SDW16374.1 site-specific DNA recombinase [Marininema mesophilum]
MSSENNLCAVYARVSLDRQSESVEHQVTLLRELAKSRELGKIPDEFIYQDTGVSATKHSLWSRPAMKQLMNDADLGKFQVVLFKGISRFARNTQEALDALDRLRSKGLRVISYEENYDSAKDSGNFTFTIHSAVAEYEAEKIAIRVRLGNKEKARKGLWMGIPPFGYDLKDRRLIINKTEAEIVRKIFDLYINEGYGSFKIAEYLNKQHCYPRSGKKWSRGTIVYILKREAYKGWIVYNRKTQKRIRDYDSDIQGKKKWVRKLNPPEDWIVVKDAHDQIIDNEMFARAQEIIHSRKLKDTAPNVYHPLTGLLFCKACGEGMVCQKRTFSNKEYRYYICKTYHKYGRSYCKQANVNAEKIEDGVALHLEKLIREKYNHLKAMEGIEKTETDIRGLEKKIKDIDFRTERLNKDNADLYFERENMNIEQYRYLSQRIKEEMDKLLEKKKALDSERASIQNDDDMNKEILDHIEKFFKTDRSDTPNFRRFLHYFIERVDIEEEKTYIQTRFNF